MTLEKSDLRFRDRFRWNTIAKRWAAEAGETLATAVRDAAPVGRREGDNHNGQLRDSIGHRALIDSRSATVQVYSRVSYVSYVIRGTPPHPIEPRNVSRLHWIEGGNHVYRSRVYHPGTKPNPFPERAAKPIAPIINGKLANVVKMSLEV